MKNLLILIIAVTLMISPTKAETTRQEGDPLETHHVTTEDGYILTIFRIPGPPGSTPVILQHGLLESSADWLIPGKEKSLAYILSDHGYDVWLGNARGNVYSKNHTTLRTTDPAFWNFSWHEIGYYDLPAVINYVTDMTKNSIFYIGHSMGCSAFSVMAIERPEVAKKVKVMYGLAPAVYTYNMRGLSKFLSHLWRQFQMIAYSLGYYEFLPQSKFFSSLSKDLCKLAMPGDTVCNRPLFLLAEATPDHIDSKLIPQILKSFPAGTSTKTIIHCLQQGYVNEFRNFDYGKKDNMKLYNSANPPNYNISKIQVPITVFWSRHDKLVGEKDVKRFYDEVPLKHGIYKIDNVNFNHLDFLWAVDAPRLVYSKILRLMATDDSKIPKNVLLAEYKHSV